MHLDVEDLRDFYTTPLGHVVRRLLTRHIRGRWASVRGQTLIGLGFASPYIGTFHAEARRIGALMPAGQGAVVWPGTGPTRTVLVEEKQLPLADNSVDRLLLIHCLEQAERPAQLLRELWRVLAPEGSVILVVPNRRGVWARIDRTPFGHGRPYSRGQLERLLTDALLTPVSWGNALHLPPIDNRVILHPWAGSWERIAGRLSPGFGGVIVVEAKKELMAPAGKVVRARAIRSFATVRGT
jgi:SAM-dependent methyltransferase